MSEVLLDGVIRRMPSAASVSFPVLILSLAAQLSVFGAPAELIGPITPSIYVPPVRTAPPARTTAISRPAQYNTETTARKRQLPYRLESLRLAIEHLITTGADAYPEGPEFLRRWQALSDAAGSGDPNLEARFRRLRDEALLANPLLDFEQLLILRRKRGQLGLPTNHQCNSALEQNGYDNELAVMPSSA